MARGVITLCLVAIFIAAFVIAPLSISKTQNGSEVYIEKHGFVETQNMVIYPEYVQGFYIKEWPVAVEEGHRSIFEVQVILTGQMNSKGPVFDNMDDAQAEMIRLAKECGI